MPAAPPARQKSTVRTCSSFLLAAPGATEFTARFARDAEDAEKDKGNGGYPLKLFPAFLCVLCVSAVNSLLAPGAVLSPLQQHAEGARAIFQQHLKGFRRLLPGIAVGDQI